MIKIIKRGGFREQTARQLKYRDSVNQRPEIPANQCPSARAQPNAISVSTGATGTGKA